MKWRDVILDWAVKLNTEAPHHLVYRSDARIRYPDLSCTSEKQGPEKTGPIYERGVKPQGGHVHTSVLAYVGRHFARGR